MMNAKERAKYNEQWRLLHPFYHRDWTRRARGIAKGKVVGFRMILGVKVQPYYLSKRREV